MIKGLQKEGIVDENWKITAKGGAVMSVIKALNEMEKKDGKVNENGSRGNL
jgi:hypothetical protein